MKSQNVPLWVAAALAVAAYLLLYAALGVFQLGAWQHFLEAFAALVCVMLLWHFLSPLKRL